jgi:hypothetical protein
MREGTSVPDPLILIRVQIRGYASQKYKSGPGRLINYGSNVSGTMVGTYTQCFGSVFNQASGSGSGSIRAKITRKIEWSLFISEGLSCNLDVFYGGLGII